MTREAMEKRRRVLAAEIAEIAGREARLPAPRDGAQMGCGRAGLGARRIPPAGTVLHPVGPARRHRWRTRTAAHARDWTAYQPWFGHCPRLRGADRRSWKKPCLRAASEGRAMAPRKVVKSRRKRGVLRALEGTRSYFANLYTRYFYLHLSAWGDVRATSISWSRPLRIGASGQPSRLLGGATCGWAGSQRAITIAPAAGGHSRGRR